MKASKVLLVTSIVLAVVIILPFIIAPILNNGYLYSFSQQLYSTPLPPNTVIIEQVKICGNLSASGNGMKYLAAILVDSTLQENKLMEYYATQFFSPAKEGGPEPIVKVVNVASSDISIPELYVYGDLKFDALKSATQLNNFFVICLYNEGYSGAFDLRAH